MSHTALEWSWFQVQSSVVADVTGLASIWTRSQRENGLSNSAVTDAGKILSFFNSQCVISSRAQGQTGSNSCSHFPENTPGYFGEGIVKWNVAPLSLIASTQI